MQIHRLFEIVYLLLEKKCITAQELAVRFEVSGRTVLRDIDVLAAAGIPIYTRQGRGGGICIADGFVLNRTALTGEEQNQILFALKSLSATGQESDAGTLSKLEALFQKMSADWIAVDFSRWGQGEKDNLRFQLLKTAIVSRTMIEFTYVSSGGETSRRSVCPLKLVFKAKAWYLQCFCEEKQDYRTFKLNRMLEIAQTQHHFDRGALTPPPIETPCVPNASLTVLELRFPARVAYRVYDEFDEACIVQAEDGTFNVTMQLVEDDWLYGFLRSFGEDVQIVRPAHMKQKLWKKGGKHDA